MPSLEVPSYFWLRDVTLRARLVTLRDRIAPILAINNLPHFTDHSISHSDQLCCIVDSITRKDRPDAASLNDAEAFVVYASCYLHDVGMQFQRAGEFEPLRTALSEEPYGGQAWADLSPQTKRELLRLYHHQVSAEMVRSSIRSNQPVLGVSLEESDYPGPIACLCEAHCIDTGSDRYRQLTQSGPGLRMPLLSALLRLADILDESRRRAQMHLERTLELDETSRMHWWRHYYVREVEFVPDVRTIRVWFDFPPDRRAEYSRLVSELQMPQLQAELERHASVLGEANLLWRLVVEETPVASSTSEAMPDDVQMRMTKELAVRSASALQAERLAVLGRLREQRPLVRRSLEDLRASEKDLLPAEYLQRARKLAQSLWETGGRRDAWSILHSEYSRVGKRAPPIAVLETGLTLCRMMLEEDASELAARTLQDLRPVVDGLQTGHPGRVEWLRLLCPALLDQCVYNEAIDRMNELVRLLSNEEERNGVRADIAEAKLLMGELSDPDVAPTGDGA